MKEQGAWNRDATASPAAAEMPSVPFGSNAVRLSMRQWAAVAAVAAALVVAAPATWKLFEPFSPGPDYRIPYALSSDYWLYERLAEATAGGGRVLVIGDSVTWGEYVTPTQTLTHYLNREHGRPLFVNGGLNGTHPLALEGLVRYYCRRVARTPVLLHCNLLWLSSPERDLQTETEQPFNHPRLIPQFAVRVPCYKASVSRRLAVVVDRQVPLRKLVQHLRVAYFDSLDVHNWSVEHPYENPLWSVRSGLPEPEPGLRHEPISWRRRGIQRQDMPWVPLAESLQWAAFERTVRLLQRRGCQLLVLLGPFNQHLLATASRRRYRALRHQALQRLDALQVAYYAPPPLPSDQYADASHPLASGYAALASQLYRSRQFQSWLGGR